MGVLSGAKDPWAGRAAKPMPTAFQPVNIVPSKPTKAIPNLSKPAPRRRGR